MKFLPSYHDFTKLWNIPCCIVLILFGISNFSATAKEFSLIDNTKETAFNCTVSSSDSSALITLYNALDGPNWTIKWDLNMPISTWHGVDLDADCKITDIRLNDNNLKGVIPNVNLPDVTFFIVGEDDVHGALPSFSNAPKLLLFQGIDCNLTDVPNYASHPTLDKILIAGNKLTFEDIIPNEMKMHQNAPFDGYSRQQKLPVPSDATIAEGGTHAIIMPDFDENIMTNVYEWFKDTVSIGAGNGKSITLTNITQANAGEYVLKVTNPNAPDLTLMSEAVTISVTSSSCMPTLTIHNNLISSGTYQVSDQIISTGIVDTGNNVIFDAKNTITLNANFTVANGGVFLAKIGGCMTALVADDSFLEDSRILIEPTTNLQATKNFSFTLFPSPASREVTIAHNIENQQHVTITLHDQMGHIITTLQAEDSSFIGHQELTFDASGLANGVYYVVVSTPTIRKSQKLMVVRN